MRMMVIGSCTKSKMDLEAALFINAMLLRCAVFFTLLSCLVAAFGQEQSPAKPAQTPIVITLAPQPPLPWYLRPEWIGVVITGVYVVIAGLTLLAIKKQANLLQQQIQDARAVNRDASLIAQNTLGAIERQASSMSEQTKLFRESVDAAKASAEATKKSAEAAKASADIAVGAAIPRLAIHQFEAATNGEDAVTPEAFFRFPRLRITIKNHGQTPAFLKWWSLCFGCDELPEVPDYDGPGAGIVLKDTVIQAGEEFTLPVLEFMRTTEFSPEDVQAILKREKIFSAFGYVCYGDVFGNPLWRFKFCYTVLNIFGGVQPCDWWEGFAPPAYFGIDHFPTKGLTEQGSGPLVPTT